MEIVQTVKPLEFHLRKSFLAPYYQKGDPFKTLLSRCTYLNKYSRDQESWTDTIRRVVEGNISLDPLVDEVEAELLFHLFWTGQVLPPGRGLWTGGVPGIPADARFNCWFVTIHNTEDWCWAMERLMLGGGVGVGLGDIHRLPIVSAHPCKLAIWCRQDHPDIDEVKTDDKSFLNGQTPIYRVEDSREGWVEAERRVFRSAFEGTDLIVDVSDVRPRGFPIKTFGGVACGPGPLAHLLRSTFGIVREASGRKLNSVECLDITNFVGLCVKSGNVRRSAIISLGDAEDRNFRDAKKDWGKVASHRHTSNNSIMFRSWQQIENFDWQSLVDDMTENGMGEPGLLNLPLGWRTDPGVKGVNPCGEALLYDYEACNLAEIFPAQFDPSTDPHMAIRLVTRYCMRQRLTPLIDSKSNVVQKKNMRLGVSLGGLCDFDWTPYQLGDWWMTCRGEANDYADALRVNRPLTTTAVKPSGCRPWYALTSTDAGILTLEEIFEHHPEDQQWADIKVPIRALQESEESSRITRTYNNGSARVLRIRLACGLEVESTENHPWWVIGHHNHKMSGEAKWVRADQIRLGDVLDVALGVYNSRTHSNLIKLNRLSLKMRCDTADIRQPEVMNPDLAWLLGYMWGDGSQSPSKYRLRFTDQHTDNLRKAQKIIFEQFSLETIIHPASEGRDAYVLDIGSKMLWHWLIRNDIFKYYAETIDLIPRVVRASSQEDIIAFVAGLVDSDGGAYGDIGKIKFMTCTKDADFARHLQRVCWAIGLAVGRSLNDEGDNYQLKKEMWFLTSNHFVDPKAFSMLHQHSVKCNKIPQEAWYWCNQKSSRRVLGKVEALEDLGEMLTYDIEVENTHWYYAGSVKSHNTTSLLNGSSPGIHAPWDEHIVRRIRMAVNDPMSYALIDAGVPFEYDSYDNTNRTLVFSFPHKSPNTKYTVQKQTLREQFERQQVVQEWWADNAVSATISFQESEKNQLASCLKEFVPRLKSTTCLPAAHGYQQAPLESVDESKYRELYSQINHDHPLVRGGDFEFEECSTGACPIK